MGDGIWEMGYGRWDMGDGIWDMGDGIWDMGDGIWDMGDGIWEILAFIKSSNSSVISDKCECATKACGGSHVHRRVRERE